MDVMTNWSKTSIQNTKMEISIAYNRVVLKEWWDPTLDAGIYATSIDQFENSEVADKIRNQIGESVYKQVLTSINVLRDMAAGRLG